MEREHRLLQEQEQLEQERRQRQHRREERERQQHVQEFRLLQVDTLVNELGIDPSVARTVLDDFNGDIIRTRYYLLRSRYVEGHRSQEVPPMAPLVTARQQVQVEGLLELSADLTSAIAEYLDGRSLFAWLLTSRDSSNIVLAAVRGITEKKEIIIEATSDANNIADVHRIDGGEDVYGPYYTPAWVFPRYMRLWLLNQSQLIDKGVQFDQFVNTRPCACNDGKRPNMQTVECIPNSLGPAFAVSDIILDIGVHFVRVQDPFEFRYGRKFGLRQYQGRLKSLFSYDLRYSHPHIEHADFVQEGLSNILPNLCAVTIGANAEQRYQVIKLYRSGVERQGVNMARLPGNDCIFSLRIVKEEGVKRGTLTMHPYMKPPYELASNLSPPFVWAAIFQDNVASSYHHMTISNPYNNAQLERINVELRNGKKLSRMVYSSRIMNRRPGQAGATCGFRFIDEPFVSRRVVWPA